MKIIFVCTGNTCRSPMAEGYFRDLCRNAGIEDVEVSSVGISAAEGAPVSDNSVEVMKSYGVDISGHKSRVIDADEAFSADMILVMTESHERKLSMLAPEIAGKIFLISDFSIQNRIKNISDPVGGSLRTYEKSFEEMKDALENLFLNLKNGKLPINRGKTDEKN